MRKTYLRYAGAGIITTIQNACLKVLVLSQKHGYRKSLSQRKVIFDIEIINFTVAHVEQATTIVKQNYNEQRRHVPVLPPVVTVPDLMHYARNGLGVAAFEGNKMIGSLCCVPPFSNAFRSTDAIGVFSPMGANGAVGENRAAVYVRMYQAAGEKWARAGVSSHAVCFYAHDKEAQTQFFKYGFGMRTVDAIRSMDEIESPVNDGYDFVELMQEECSQLLPLNMDLVAHLGKSPAFMKYPHITEEGILAELQHGAARYFVAKDNGFIIAYLKIADDGENFACDVSDMKNISGAYCLPNYRGNGLFDNLLNAATVVLRREGYVRLGVDFESFNLTAWGFWLKYFDAYTYGVVRRIDEYAIIK